MPKVSVIIPVYNVEAFVGASLDSLKRQTYGDFEAVCINDGSTDGSLEVLETYAATDSRIRIVSIPNGGLGHARNTGLDVAQGEIVCFLDSDDEFSDDALEKIVAGIELHDADIVTFGGKTIPEDAITPWLSDVLSPRTCYYPEFSLDVLFKEKSRPLVRTALTRSFVKEHNIRFVESLRIGEDQVFDFAIYPRANRIQFIADKLYLYRINRDASLMQATAKDPCLTLKRHCSVVKCVFDDWASLGILKSSSAVMLSWTVEFVLYDALRLADDQCEEVFSMMREILLSYWTADEIRATALSSAVAAIIRACIKSQRFSRYSRLWLMSRYYLFRYGAKAMLVRIVRGGKEFGL